MYYYGSGYNYAPYPAPAYGGYGGGWGNTWAVILVIFLLLIIVGVWLNGNNGCRGFGHNGCCCSCGGC